MIWRERFIVSAIYAIAVVVLNELCTKNRLEDAAKIFPECCLRARARTRMLE